MQCRACDAAMAGDARFCAACGTPVSGERGTARRMESENATHDLPSGLGSSIAKGAAIGAVAAIPIPFVGPITGAVIGAGIAAYKKLKD